MWGYDTIPVCSLCPVNENGRCFVPTLGPSEPTFILASGKERLLSQHVLHGVWQRDISVEWVAQTIDNPIAVVDDEKKNSTNYFGYGEYINQLLKVAVSKEGDRTIVTTHFDTGATRRHQRGEL